MKALLIASLLIAISSVGIRTTNGPFVTIAAAQAQNNVCPQGSLSNSYITVDAAGATYTADQCTMSSSINIRCQNIPRGQIPVSVVLANSTLNRDGTIVFVLPAFNNAANNLIPLVITIRNNKFAPQTQLSFQTGSLPPNSKLTIEGNWWDKLTSVAAIPVVRLINFAALQLLTSAEVTIANNDFRFLELTNFTDMAAVYTSTMRLNSECKFTMNSNRFDIEGYKSRRVFGLNAGTWTMLGNSTVETNDNHFTIRNGFAWLYPTLVSEGTVSQRRTLNILRNTIDAQSESDTNAHNFVYNEDIRVASIDGLIADNNFTCHACNGKWEFDRLVLSGTNPSMQFVRNTLTVSNGTVPQIVYAYVEITSNGVVTIADNILNATTQILTDRSPWLYFGQMTFKTSAMLQILRNIFDAYYMPTRPCIATSQYFFSAEGVGTANAPRVYICGNNLFGSRPSSNEYIRLYMSKNLADLMNEGPLCAKLYLPWGLSTDEPMDSGSTALLRLSMTTVMSALVGAVVVMML